VCKVGEGEGCGLLFIINILMLFVNIQKETDKPDYSVLVLLPLSQNIGPSWVNYDNELGKLVVIKFVDYWYCFYKFILRNRQLVNV